MPVPMTPERMRERITLLLRKAESTTPAEAEALTEQAERLAIQHGIDLAAAIAQASTGGSPFPEEEIVSTWVAMPKPIKYSKFYANIYARVALAMGMQAYLSGSRGGPAQVVIIGYQSDISTIQSLGASLVIQGEHAYRQWLDASADQEAVRLRWFGTDQQKFVARRSFLMAFAQGAEKRIRDNRTKLTEQTKGTGTDLVLIDRAAKIKAVAEERHKTRKTRAVKATQQSQRAGYVAGQNARTGEGELDGGRAALAR